MKKNTLYTSTSVPINHGILLGMLKNYKRPNDKISYMIEKGRLVPLKKSLYIFKGLGQNKSLTNFLLANTLYGPSYVSLFSALSYYGFIPEQVMMVESSTVKRSKYIETPVKNFKYYSSSKKIFHIGINYIKVADDVAFLIASPTKALCDIIINTNRLNIHSQRAMKLFLEENIRLDMDRLKELDSKILEKCITAGKKSKQLKYIHQLLQTK